MLKSLLGWHKAGLLTHPDHIAPWLSLCCQVACTQRLLMQLTQAEDSLQARHNLAPVEQQVMKVVCALGTHHTGAA